MKKIIRLTESDLARIVEKVLKQKNIQEADPMDGTSDFPLLAANDEKKPEDDIESMTQQVAEYWARRRRLQESQMMMDVYPKITKCYDDANKVSNKKFGYPTVCKSGLSQDCIEKLKLDTSKYAGANKLSSKLGYCLTKIDKKIADSQQGLG